MNLEIKIPKNLIIKERNVKSNLEAKPFLKQVLSPKDISLYAVNKGLSKGFVSPYARTNKTAEATIKYAGPYKSGDELLEQSQDSNVPMEGWSAKDILKMREELCSNMKPETLQALEKLREKNKNIHKKGITREEEFLSKVRIECKNDTEENANLKETKIDDNNTDLSFMPITPNNKLLNMNKVEFDKLEWMRQIEMKAESTKSLAIRFHVNGQVMEPEIDQGEDFMKVVNEEFDPYLDSLRHHGEEPGREGYTINELFWLARSSFPQQRHLAVTALINIMDTSKQLKHAHQFNVTTITQNLVDCGILFLARWLIDDAGLRHNHLEDAFKLLHVILVSDNSDKWLLNWPELRVIKSQPRLMSKSSSEEERSRKSIPLSERTEIQDDILMDEDIISCIVIKTHLLTRLSWLIVTNRLVSDSITAMVLEILQRIASHSLEMVSSLCHDHEELLERLIQSHLNINSPLLSHLLRLLRLIANSSQSIAYKITKNKKIISLIYDVITFPNIKKAVQVEVVRLTSVLIHQEVHFGPIVEFTPILLESYTANINNSEMSLYVQAVAVFLSSLISSEATITPETYTLIAEAANLSQSYVKSMITNELNFHNTSTIIHFCNTFFTHQYSSAHCSSSDTVINYWTHFLLPILQSKILPVIYQKVSFNTILGYEHSNPNLKLVKLDLHNLLQYSTTLAAQTANPNYIDLKPFFIDLHPSVSILSSVSHALLSMINSKMNKTLLPNLSNAFSDLINNEYLEKYLTKVSESSYNNTVPSSAPYSAIAQLELETMSQVILTIVSISCWIEIPLSKSFAIIIYKATLKILPHLGPDLQFLAQKLVDVVVFSLSIISIVATAIPKEIITLLFSQLPSIMLLYKEHIASFQQYVPLQKKVACKLSIDYFIIPQDWIDVPINELYNLSKQSPDIKVNTDSMLSCLTFIMFLEFDKMLPLKQAAIVGLYRLSYLLISVDWIETLCEDDNKLVVSLLMQHYLSQPHLIDISVTYNKTLSFYNLYDDLLLKYFYDSLSDPKMANIVMFPCAMRFPVKYRQYLWGQYSGNIRLLTLDVSESMFPIEEYLSPEEVSNSMLRGYWRALRDRQIIMENNALLYWICIHHINRFIYNQAIFCETSKEKELIVTQRGFVRVIVDNDWQSKQWIQHVRLYKQFEGNLAQFYNDIPKRRRQHLELISSYFKK